MNFLSNSSEGILNYLFLFFLFVGVLKFLIVSFSVFCLMKRRGIKFKFLAFVPVVNSTYCLASVSDSINSNYFNETKSRFLLLMLKIIFLCSVLILCQVIAVKLTGVILGDYYIGDLVQFFLSSDVACYVLNFTVVVALIYLIYLFKIYYNIYSEYGGPAATPMLLGAIFSYVFFKFYFVPDLFIYLIRNKNSKFEKLNAVV